MFRKMRRAMQLLPEEENIAILERGQTGILACLGDDDYPYTVPLNYVYADGKIFFHCAKTGHKIDAITSHDKVSFCVIDRDDVDVAAQSTNYRSVIVFGRARVIGDDEEKRQRVFQFGMKYVGNEAPVNAEIEREWNALAMVEITIEHMTGKERKTLAQARREGHTDQL